MLHQYRRRLIVAAALAIGALAGAAVARAALQTPQPVVTAKGSQYFPAAAPAAAYLAYLQSRPGHPNQYDIYVKPAGQPRYQVTKRGRAYVGGIDGTTLIYQTVHHNQSDLRLFDMATHTRSEPSGVNSRRWEWGPSISGDWILFGRTWSYRPYNHRILLHNTNTGETRVLDEQIGAPAKELTPAQVNGDFAVWDRFVNRSRNDNVFVYQISTGTTTKVPAPSGKVQYYPSVSATGTVFYVRSDKACGKHVVIREYASGVDTPLASLPRGYDADSTFAVDEGGGETSVYFDRFQCSTGKSHIYKLTVS